MYGKCEACLKIQNMSIGVWDMLPRKNFEIYVLKIEFGINFGRKWFFYYHHGYKNVQFS